MLLNPLTFHSPKTLDEALKLYSSVGNVRLQAGGTFLLNSLKLLKRNGVKTPDHVISLRKVGELQGLSVDAKQMTIRSMTTIDDLFESPLLQNNFKIFRQVCRNISTQPIRNVATVGGNLTCRYTWTEMPAVMVGLEAQMHFMDVSGKEETMTSEDFFKALAKTDKIFTYVSIPQDKEATLSYRRVSKTQGVDIPLLSLLIKTHFKNDQFTNTRVAVNNCVSFAQRDTKLEEFLNQNKISEKIAVEALNHLDEKIYDTRSGDYKKHMFRVSIKNAILELIKNKKEGVQVSA